ncbi:hypothetical protein [Qipengyuania sp. ASV99]|uniref:hypothetical protein n=1 Tax=Qipengyuania sp. ASV99 TaxID=3399681 RepID=UPI003A4C7761
MKRIALVAALATIAACTPAAETEAPAEPAAVEAVAATTAADGGPSHGMYRVTDSEGKVSMEDVREDGTWSSTDDEGVVTTGTWEQKSPNIYCATADTEGAEQECHDEVVDETGVWTSTDSEGKVATIERVTG